MLLNQANAPAHTSSQAVAAVTNSGFKLLCHPLYSQALAPSVLYMFPNLTEYLRWFNIFDDKDVICTENGQLEKQEELLLYNGIYTLEKLWTKCISVEEEYVKMWQILVSTTVEWCPVLSCLVM